MSVEELQKHTLNLRLGDMDYLLEVYSPKGVSPSLLIRRLVSQHVDQLRKKEGPINLELGDI